MTILEFLAAINGVAQLWGGNGVFLGLLSSDRYDSKSITNPHGAYGSSWEVHSIYNPHGLYGGSHGMYSPYNTFCLKPPIIFYQEQPVLVVTRNPYARTDELSVVDPDLLTEVYTQLDAPRYNNTQEVLSRASQSLARVFAGESSFPDFSIFPNYF